MNLALKVDVDTYRGTRDGVPRLVELLKKHDAGATFLFSLGPDHTGRAIKRMFRRGFFKQGAPHLGGVALRHDHAALRHGTAGAGHRPPLRRHHARGARRRLRGRHPHL